ncbi:hypothetical protein [Streptomyces huasconensis]|uniref:hypothetical protein n=1 Tax=Streptomyces huasconensis TaxID=1854574 RepID=UPI0036F61FAE
MADFRRRLPEWQQSADRHTSLTDPVLTVRQLSRFDFSRKTLTRIDHALVFSSPKGSYDAFLPPLRPSRSEVAARRYTAVYEVDMGVHPFLTELALPSDNDAFEFGADAELSWQVVDPACFVASGHRDVHALLIGELQQAARPVTRRFAIDRSAEAEAELLRTMASVGPLGVTAGLKVTWTLRLRRDRESIDHQRRLQAIDHTTAEQVHGHLRGMEHDRAFDQRARQQDALQVARATDYGRAQQELELQQRHWQHERALLQGQHDLELQRFEADKIAFYQWHLEQGGVQAWALHLAQHPEDSRLVMTSMREDQLRLIQAQMDLVGKLLSGDNAENYELEGPKQLALRTVSDILNQRLPGVPQQTSTPPPPQLAPQSSNDTEQATPPASPAPPAPPMPPAPPVDLSGWQPPPGYGSTPSMPPTPPAPASAAPTAEAETQEASTS